MQKLFKDCYAMDQKCYEQYKLTEDILMEHAATALEKSVRELIEKKKRVTIVAGPGNNGADGIVAARLLKGDYKVRLYLPFGAKSEMAKLQLERAKSVGVKIVEKLKKSEVLIDALFGAGLNRELNSESQAIIEKMNAHNGYKLACDIPSGLSKEGYPYPVAFRADKTVTMGALKEALYLDGAKDFVGEVVVADLGVSRKLYEDKSDTFLLEREDFKPPLRKVQNCHKGTFGHVAIFAGDKEGAAIIAAMAASRFGAGLTTIVHNREFPIPPYLMHANTTPHNTTAIAIGMGLGNYYDDEVLKKEVIDTKIPVVLDADALSNPKLLEIVQQEREAVVTPHPKEFQRVLQILEKREVSIEEIQKNRFEFAHKFSLDHPFTTLLLKGANPIIAKAGRLYLNPLGDRVLAKGGSGDVLSGLIASLLAQGYSGVEAAIQGSLALALASQKFKKPNYYLVPVDIIKLLSKI